MIFVSLAVWSKKDKFHQISKSIDDNNEEINHLIVSSDDILSEVKTSSERAIRKERGARKQSIGPTTYIDLLDTGYNDESNSAPSAKNNTRISSMSDSSDDNGGDSSSSGTSTLVEPLLQHNDDTQWDQDEHLVKLASSYVRDALKGRYNRFAPWAVDVVVAGSRKRDTQKRLSLHRTLHNMRFFRKMQCFLQ